MQNLGIHITYDRDITIKELSDILNLINISINDYYREKGILNFSLGGKSPSINGIKEGSIFFDVVIPALEAIEEITPEIMLACLMSRLYKLEEKNGRKSKMPFLLSINIGSNNTINFNVSEKDENKNN